ncbi:hypothetical protein AVEN_31520-1 [Araneus ventricosus]|uniref:Uncharacterized protein n=1 Tax=Araneus ventricosus TaxID=182803 RepID=A0A4Y2SGB4_ARAVE|nr:hypothetical protein AVEN_31520-1 [Araneus ventricosus]
MKIIELLEPVADFGNMKPQAQNCFEALLPYVVNSASAKHCDIHQIDFEGPLGSRSTRRGPLTPVRKTVTACACQKHCAGTRRSKYCSRRRVNLNISTNNKGDVCMSGCVSVCWSSTGQTF